MGRDARCAGHACRVQVRRFGVRTLRSGTDATSAGLAAHLRVQASRRRFVRRGAELFSSPMIRMLDALFAGALAKHVTAPAWSAARMPVTMSAGDGGGPRPPVKSGFYKRPAAAVERGGGFLSPASKGRD